jgi:hypothetical protein
MWVILVLMRGRFWLLLGTKSDKTPAKAPNMVCYNYMNTQTKKVG